MDSKTEFIEKLQDSYAAHSKVLTEGVARLYLEVIDKQGRGYGLATQALLEHMAHPEYGKRKPTPSDIVSMMNLLDKQRRANEVDVPASEEIHVDTFMGVPLDVLQLFARKKSRFFKDTWQKAVEDGLITPG